jgi:hypothetical protein
MTTPECFVMAKPGIPAEVPKRREVPEIPNPLPRKIPAPQEPVKIPRVPAPVK